jgi:hypothetical protein
MVAQAWVSMSFLRGPTSGVCKCTHQVVHGGLRTSVNLLQDFQIVVSESVNYCNPNVIVVMMLGTSRKQAPQSVSNFIFFYFFFPLRKI